MFVELTAAFDIYIVSDGIIVKNKFMKQLKISNVLLPT